ncbi:MAG: hypothetical protein M3301_10255 [Chloroflexota bacterium]|nr:hypothetical protein [Chloroflexota bacterium]
MKAEGAVTATGRAEADLPYRASWVDYLTDAIDRLPISGWACYALLVGGGVLLINAMGWIGGQYPPGTFDLRRSGYPVHGVYMLALVHYLNGVASSKIATFRPALDVDPQEFRRLHYQLTTLPSGRGALAGLGGVSFVALIVASDPPDAGIGTLSLAVLIGGFLVEALTIALFAVLIYHTIHQLGMVSRIHALASRIDLFEPGPLYAFSHLTARTGIGLVVLTAYSFLIDPSINPVAVGLTALVAVVAAAAFVLPLEGMHRRIVVEKERLQLEANRRLKVALAQLHQSVDERDLSIADGLNKTLESLQLERDAIARMPTWPWEPGTLRAFVSALLVPIVLWLIIRALERFV